MMLAEAPVGEGHFKRVRELLLGRGIEPIGDDWVRAEVGLGREGQ